MDFKKLMSAQISKSKTPTANASSISSKYQRRADIEAEREAAYVAEQAKIKAEREERAAKKRKLEEADAEKTAEREAKLAKLSAESKARREAQELEEERQRRQRLGLPPLPDPSNENAAEDSLADGQEDIPDDDLQTRLRELDEPAVLYDESHLARLKRYYSLTSASLTTKPQLSNTPIPTTLPLLSEKDMLLPTTLPNPNSPEQQHLYRQIASYFTLLLSNWSTDLNLRSPSTSSSQSGRLASQNYHTVLRDLTPLFRRLESSSLDAALLPPLCNIIRHAQARQYVRANDAYLTLSIGKAAWPIGVTMVGIHERSAREKLHQQDNQAHILADEVTRKILQSVKRCLSYAQVRWPPEDRAEMMG